MFNALGVKAVLSQNELANVRALRLIGRDLDTRVYENTTAYPRAWIVHDVHIVGREDDAVEFLEARGRRDDGAVIIDDFNPRHEAVIEHRGETTGKTLSALQNGPGACGQKHSDRASIEHYSAETVTLDINAACPGLLVLSDTHFPGWRATVNGRDQTIYATDVAFRGVAVPKGTSRVEFRYEPRPFASGIVLAAAGLVAFLAVGLFSWWRCRSRPDGPALTRP
jgi:hypothetical protein